MCIKEVWYICPTFSCPNVILPNARLPANPESGKKKYENISNFYMLLNYRRTKVPNYRFLQYIRLYSKSTKNFTKNRYTMLIIIISHEILRTFLQNILLHHDKFSAYKYPYTIHTYLPLYILNYTYLFKEIDARNYISIIL